MKNNNYSAKELYNAYLKGKNIIELLKDGNSEEYNLLNKMNYIEIAYDLQSGTYIEAMNNPQHAALKIQKCKEIASLVSSYISNPKSLLKGGVGEAVTLVPILDALPNKIENVHGFDISWSRVINGKSYLVENGYTDFTLCTGELQSIPYVDNSFDLILTSHSLEPNGGNEKEILLELMRVSSNIVALFEPSFEFASEKGKARMIKHGYVKNLPGIAKELGFKVLAHHKLETSISEINSTAALILQVPNPHKPDSNPKFSCPVSKRELVKYDHGFFSEDSFLFFPVIENIPTLRPQNGILASAIMKRI